MKKNLVLLALIGFAMFTLCGCGGKSEVEQRKTEITVKGADGTIYESYQECCAAEDFQAAHQYLAKMENSDDWQGDLGEAKEYVFKQEALYLMSIGDAAAQKRIIYLLKESDDDDELVSTLIDIAIDDDDKAFVKKLANQYTNDVDDENLKKIAEYFASDSSVETKEYLKTLFKGLDKTNLLIDLAIKDNDMAFIDEYASSDLSLSDTSLLEFLSARNEKKYSEIIVGLLTQEESTIGQRPQMGLVTFAYDNLATDYKYKCDNFSYSVVAFNKQCKNLLGISIKTRNQYLAQRVVSKFKSNIHTDRFDFRKIKITLDNSDINEAKNTYEAAVRSGSFK